MTDLRSIFENYAKFAAEPVMHSDHAALGFEQATGLSGISAAYNFPKGQDADHFEYWARWFCGFGAREENRKGTLQHLKRTWGKLAQLNPVLRPITTGGNPYGLRHAIFGASSLFNPDDINFYIELQKRANTVGIYALCHGNESYRHLEEAIDWRVGIRRRWIASPQTMALIFEQVKDRPCIHKPGQNPPPPSYTLPPHIKPITNAQIEKANAYIDSFNLPRV